MPIAITNSETLSSVLRSIRHRIALDSPVQNRRVNAWTTEASLNHLMLAVQTTLGTNIAGFKWRGRDRNLRRAGTRKVPSSAIR